jgi:hypothetical protein
VLALAEDAGDAGSAQATPEADAHRRAVLVGAEDI